MNFWVVSEIDEQTELHASCLEIIDDLGTVLVGEIWHGFEFEDDFAEADKIRDERVSQTPVFVGERKLLLCIERNVLEFQFCFETLLIDWHSESTALQLIDLKAGSAYAK